MLRFACPYCTPLISSSASQRWNWKDSFLQRDLEKRGVSSLPNYLYRDDAKANYDVRTSLQSPPLSPSAYQDP